MALAGAYLMLSSTWQRLPTWVWELSAAALVLGVVSEASGGGLVQRLSALAVLLSFAHAQVASRLDEAEERRTEREVHCRAWLVRYLVAKEIAWVAVFAFTGAWPAVAGCALFLAYPAWRTLWRARLVWAPPGELGEQECWVLFVGPRMYAADTRVGVAWQWLRHRGDDRFLVG